MKKRNGRWLLAIPTAVLVFLTLFLPGSGGSQVGRKEYVCPPCGCSRDNEVFDKSGTCPACGMSLIEKASLAAPQTRPRVFAAVFERGPSWISGKPSFDQPYVHEHIEYLGTLGQKLIAAAPFSQRQNDPTVGLILLFAESEKEAMDWINRDPTITSGVMTARLYGWGIDSLKGCF